MMGERSRALLINALGFPGMGQLLVLGRKRMGCALVVVSLAALLGLSWALAHQVLDLLPGRSPERLLAAPWELQQAVSGALRAPGEAALIWGLLLLLGWLLALVDVVLWKPSDRGDASQGNQ